MVWNAQTNRFMPLVVYAKNYFILIEQKDYECKAINIFKGRAKDMQAPPGVIGFLIEKKVVNELGMDDRIYYYLISRKYWWKRWADEKKANVTKDRGIEGCSFEYDIYQDMLDHKVRSVRSVLTIAIFQQDNKIIFHYVKVPDLFDYITKFGSWYTDQYNRKQVGIPKRITITTDSFK